VSTFTFRLEFGSLVNFWFKILKISVQKFCHWERNNFRQRVWVNAFGRFPYYVYYNFYAPISGMIFQLSPKRMGFNLLHVLKTEVSRGHLLCQVDKRVAIQFLHSTHALHSFWFPGNVKFKSITYQYLSSSSWWLSVRPRPCILKLRRHHVELPLIDSVLESRDEL